MVREQNRRRPCLSTNFPLHLRAVAQKMAKTGYKYPKIRKSGDFYISISKSTDFSEGVCQILFRN